MTIENFLNPCEFFMRYANQQFWRLYMLRLTMLILFFAHLSLSSYELDPDVLIYGDTIQVNSAIGDYENVVAGKPIHAYIMVTHNANRVIDPNSFWMGDKPLQVKFVKSVPMSNASSLVISIYHFQIQGLTTGFHSLPPIKVKVGGKDYQAPPLIIQVG